MEKFQDYARQLNAIRSNTKGSLLIPEHKTVLIAYEMLAIHVFRTFKIPENQEQYMMRSFGIPDVSNPSTMVGHLIRNNNKINGHFSLELPLRGLEVYFSYGKEQTINPSDFSILDLLIYRLAEEIERMK